MEKIKYTYCKLKKITIPNFKLIDSESMNDTCVEKVFGYDRQKQMERQRLYVSVCVFVCVCVYVCVFVVCGRKSESERRIGERFGVDSPV